MPARPLRHPLMINPKIVRFRNSYLDVLSLSLRNHSAVRRNRVGQVQPCVIALI